jgi:ferric-dicitrate binding protein FerR (iron transport regulator)
MKLLENNTEHLELIAKYLANEMDENEKANFEIDIALDADNQRLIGEMKRDWTMLDSYNNRKKVNANNAWDKLSGRLRDENLVPSQNKVKIAASRRMLAYAATLLGIAVLGTTALWLNSKKEKPQMLSILNSNGSTIVQTLADGSIVYVGNSSTFEYPKAFSKDERKVALKGQAYFDIARNPQKPFIIETKDAYIQVLGTAFNVKSYSESRFELIVERGKVKVSLKKDPNISQTVTAGERMVIDNSNLVKSTWHDDGSLAWRMGKMQFKDETLQNIVNVVNRNYGSHITIADQQTAARRLTVTFEENSIDTITELVCVTLNIEYKKANNQIILSSKNGQ